jgi:hypothetical protein
MRAEKALPLFSQSFVFRIFFQRETTHDSGCIASNRGRKLAMSLDDKIVSTFNTHMGHEGRAVRNMEKLLAKVAPGVRLIAPGFSATVDGFRGPLNEAEIPRAREFGKTLAQEMLG